MRKIAFLLPILFVLPLVIHAQPRKLNQKNTPSDWRSFYKKRIPVETSKTANKQTMKVNLSPKQISGIYAMATSGSTRPVYTAAVPNRVRRFEYKTDSDLHALFQEQGVKRFGYKQIKSGVKIVFRTTKPVMARGLTITTAASSKKPKTVRIAARSNKQEVEDEIVYARGPVSQAESFAPVKSNQWVVTIFGNQPVQIKQIKLDTKNGETKIKNYTLYWRGFSDRTYYVYRNHAYPNPSMPVPNSVSLNFDQAVLAKTKAAEDNPHFTKPDLDDDGIPASEDNCPYVTNPKQRDPDKDGVGYACEDNDGDGVINKNDNCPDKPNPNQTNRDGDQNGDVCDPSIDTFNQTLESRPWLIPMMLVSGLLILGGLGFYLYKTRGNHGSS